MGNYPYEVSQIKTTFKVSSEMTKYKESVSPELTSSDGIVKYSFRSSNALWQWPFHVNLEALLRILKKVRHLSIDLETNRLSATILLTSFWMSLIDCGNCIYKTTYFFRVGLDAHLRDHKA